MLKAFFSSSPGSSTPLPLRQTGGQNDVFIPQRVRWEEMHPEDRLSQERKAPNLPKHEPVPWGSPGYPTAALAFIEVFFLQWWNTNQSYRFPKLCQSLSELIS
jgi:hypothetical protein